MATTQSTPTQTNRSAGAKKAAATRSANARKRSAAAKKAAATRAEAARTPVDYATEYAEKAVLIPLGAGLVSGGDLELAPRAERRCFHCPRAVGGGGVFQLVHGAPGRLDIARGERDLDLSRQELGSSEAVTRVIGERSSDRGARGLHPALGQAEQGETGLRIAAQLVRLPEGLLGRREIAESESNLSELIERLRRGPDSVRTQLLTRLRRLAGGISERPPQS